MGFFIHTFARARKASSVSKCTYSVTAFVYIVLAMGNYIISIFFYRFLLITMLKLYYLMFGFDNNNNNN